MIDTHSHIYLEEFDNDREAVVEHARKAGLRHLVLPNVDMHTYDAMVGTHEAHSGYTSMAMGLHPTSVEADWIEQLDATESHFDDHKFVAVGEVGIDLYWDESRREEQVAILQRQAEWAARFHLPLVIHSRSAHRLLVDTLLPFADSLPGGVFHCFSGTTEEAQELLDCFPRFVLGIGGVVTFKKSTLPATLRAAVPLDRIVVETDCPYLAPTPHRGKRNEPAYVPLVIEKLADIYEVMPEKVAQQTTETAKRLFHL